MNDSQDGQSGQTSTQTAVAPPPCALTRLEHARALPELEQGEQADQVSTGIQSFKDEDRRTMNVVTAGGQLFKQLAVLPAPAEV